MYYGAAAVALVKVAIRLEQFWPYRKQCAFNIAHYISALAVAAYY